MSFIQPFSSTWRLEVSTAVDTLETSAGITRIFSESDYASLTLARAAAEAVNGLVMETSSGRLSMANNLILQTTTEGTHDGVFVISSTGSESQADGAVLLGYGDAHATWPGHLFLSALTTSDLGRIFSDNHHKLRRTLVVNGRWAQTLGTYDYLDCPDADGIVHIFADSGTLGTVSPELSGFTAATTGNLLVIESNASTDVGMTLAAPNTCTLNIYFGDPENTGSGRIAYDHPNDRLFFSAGASALFYLNGNGEGAIGTTPVSNQRFTIRGKGTSSSTFALDVEDSGGTLLMQIRDDGPAGVGTAPVSSQRLTVQGLGATSSTLALDVEDSGSTVLMQVRDDGSSSFGTTPVTNQRLTVRGFGTSSSTFVLDLEDSGGGLLMQVRDDGVIYAPPFYNQTTASAANLNAASNGLIARSTSLMRWKHDIRVINKSAVDQYMEMDGFAYRSLCEHDCKEAWHIGFSADEAHERGLKELVFYDNDNKPDGFQYERAVVFHHTKIKSLSEAVEGHDSKILSLVDIARDHGERITELERKAA